jgi:chemotaxis protein methyltransferase CheR
MAPEDFAFLARLLRRRSGLSLTESRAAMIQRRLAPVMQRFGFRDLAALVHDLRLGRDSLAEAVTEAMTVNDTAFFRDPALFATLRDPVLPRLIAARAGSRRLKIWSAATAAGQEAYSIAMLLAEMPVLRDWTVEIMATDLSEAAIRRAEAGRYADWEVESGFEPAVLARHFERDGAEWVARDGLRRVIHFRRFNLLDSFGWLDGLDLVFCRNVLMYFDAASRTNVLERLGEAMAADGLLLLGENEVVEGSGFWPSPDGPGIYSRERALLARAS